MRKFAIVLTFVLFECSLSLLACDNSNSYNPGNGGNSTHTSRLVRAYEWVIEEYPSAVSCFTLASDESFVGVDTNPYDVDDFYVTDSFTAIEEFNHELGLADYIWEEMLHTSAMDGRISETSNGIMVSWKYSTYNGLEATYRLA